MSRYHFLHVLGLLTTTNYHHSPPWTSSQLVFAHCCHLSPIRFPPNIQSNFDKQKFNSFALIHLHQLRDFIALTEETKIPSKARKSQSLLISPAYSCFALQRSPASSSIEHSLFFKWVLFLPATVPLHTQLPDLGHHSNSQLYRIQTYVFKYLQLASLPLG